MCTAPCLPDGRELQLERRLLRRRVRRHRRRGAERFRPSLPLTPTVCAVLDARGALSTPGAPHAALAPSAASLARALARSPDGSPRASCSRFGPVYPPRPAPSEGPPAAEPQPARVVAHLAVTSAALRQALDDAAPRTGDGTVRFLGGDRPYTWERGPLDVGFSQGRIVLKTQHRREA